MKAAEETIGILQMVEGLRYFVTAEVFVDSSAALSVTQRKGTGNATLTHWAIVDSRRCRKKEELKF